MTDQSLQISAPPSNPRHPYRSKFFQFLKRCFNLLEKISPRLVATILFHLWFKTKHRELRAPEQKIMALASTETIQLKDWNIKLYRWGNPEHPRVLVAHGWGSVAASLYKIIEALLAQNYSVVAMDGPGHGASSGNQASLFDYAEVLKRIGHQQEPLIATIGHSAGGLCSTMALSHGLSAQKAVTIGAPNRIESLVDTLCLALELQPKSITIFKTLFEARFGKVVWDAGSADSNAKSLTIPGLIIHDHDDDEIACSNSTGLHQAWPDSKLLHTQGLGHKKILGDKKVIQAILEFIQ